MTSTYSHQQPSIGAHSSPTSGATTSYGFAPEIASGLNLAQNSETLYNAFAPSSATSTFPGITRPCAEPPYSSLGRTFGTPTTGTGYSGMENNLSKLALCADSVGVGSVTSTPSIAGSSSLSSVSGNFALPDDNSMTAAAMAAAAYQNQYGTPYGVVPYSNLPAGSSYGQPFSHFTGMSNYASHAAAMTGAYGNHLWMNMAGRMNPYGGYVTVPGGKKGRQTYSRQQTTILEAQYKTNKYATKAQRRMLSEHTFLRDRQIKIWFQNRRMKDKKDSKKQEEEKQLAAARRSPVSSLKHSDKHSHSQSMPSSAPQQVELQATNTALPLKQEWSAKSAAISHQQRSQIKPDSKHEMKPVEQQIMTQQHYSGFDVSQACYPYPQTFRGFVQ